MWRGIKKVLPFVAISGAGYFGYETFKEYNFRTVVENSESFIVYSPTGKTDFSADLSHSKFPVLNTSQGFRPSSYGLTLEKTSTGVNFVKKFNGQFLISPLEAKEKFEKWVQFHTCPYKTISSRSELLQLLKKRKKTAFLDSFVLFYAPPGDTAREKILDSAIAQLYYKDSMSKYLTSSSSSYLHLIRITDPALADELKIAEDSVFLKISDPRGTFSSTKFRSHYQDPAVTQAYHKEKAEKNFTVNGHEFQLDNQIYFDRFTLNKDSEGRITNFDEVFDRLMRVDSLILPFFNTKQLMLNGPKLLMLSQEENSKILVVSFKMDKIDRSSLDPFNMARALKLEQFAKENPNVLVIMGHPEILYHLPFRDLAIYHYEDAELRLFTLNKGTVINAQIIDEGMSLEDLMKSDEIRLEFSPVKVKQNAEVLNVEKFNEKVLGDTNRCAFVMNCSKTCPACVYSEKFFQEAAAMSQKCKFYKYYVSNQNLRYKGPNSTPRFYLFKPGTTVPVTYEQKVHGFDPASFLGFIDKNLE